MTIEEKISAKLKSRFEDKPALRVAVVPSQMSAKERRLYDQEQARLSRKSNKKLLLSANKKLSERY